ncbi:MAG TPA: LamG-like jellyroll fold domain-containing protein, partial [Candidatus Eisenbacteria bacterium]|nr:LamG-like jellyroll fold domain-containing protein [Candidatus Eisenbacteria bacterium]
MVLLLFLVPVLSLEAPSAFSQTCSPVPSGGLGWWSAEGNAYDRLDGGHGTPQGGVTFQAGKVGQAFAMDGLDDWVRVPDAPNLRPSSLTIEGWFQFTATSGGRILVAKTLGTGGLNSFALFYNGSSMLGGISDLAGFGPFVTFAFAPSPGTWYHLAYTFNDPANSQALYLNGVLATSGSVTKSIAYDAHPVQIGAEFNNEILGGFFGGRADEISIYGRALTAAELQGIVAASSAGKCDPPTPVCAAIPTGIISWWAGEGNAGDRVDGNPGSLQNGDAYESGKVGSAFSLDGENDWVQIADAPSLRPANLTIEGWFVFRDPSRAQILLTKTLGAGTLNSYTLYFDGTSVLGVVADATGFGPFLGIPLVPVAGAWYHLAYTFDDASNSQALYVNGSLRASGSVTKSIGYDAHPVQIGAEYSNEVVSAFFDGLADDLVLYARALSGSEIRSIYDAGASGKCAPPDRAPIASAPPSANAMEGALLSVSVSALDPDADAITSLSADLASLPAGHGAIFTPGPGNTSGLLTWTPSFSDAGTYNVSFVVQNALTGFAQTQLLVANSDRAPTLTAPSSVAGVEGLPLTISVTALDPDGDPVTSLLADVGGLPSGHGATFVPNLTNTEGSLTWIPTYGDAGDYVIVFHAANALQGSAVTEVTIVNADRPPEVVAPQTAAATEGAPFHLTVSVTDPDGDPLDLLDADLSGLPAGHDAVFSANGTSTEGTLAWNPTYADAGTYTVRFIATNSLADTAATEIGVENVILPSSIVGRVYSNCPQPGTGLHGVTVDAYTQGAGNLVGTTVTDEDGNYEITALLDGDYVLTIVPPLGYLSSSQEVLVHVTSGQGATVNFAL